MTRIKSYFSGNLETVPNTPVGDLVDRISCFDFKVLIILCPGENFGPLLYDVNSGGYWWLELFLDDKLKKMYFFYINIHKKVFILVIRFHNCSKFLDNTERINIFYKTVTCDDVCDKLP